MPTKKKYKPKSYNERGVSSSRPFTECTCPKCEIKHKMKLKWIGRGKPKKFCPSCNGKIGKIKGLPQDVSGAKLHLKGPGGKRYG